MQAKFKTWGAVLSAAVLTACGGGGGGGASTTVVQPSVNSTNYSVDEKITNLSNVFSIAGKWIPNNKTNATTNQPISIANSFYSQILLANGRNGLILNGWSYDGWSNNAFYPVNMVLMEQNSDGTLTVATDKYISDTLTNGSGSVVVADLDGDGRKDIFMTAHNESPFIAKSSTAYISNTDGTFRKISINDAVAAHDAKLVKINGVSSVITATYRGTPSYYQWINNRFNQTPQTPNSYIDTNGITQTWNSAGYASIDVSNLDSTQKLYAAVSDNNYGPGLTYVQGAPQLISIYGFNDFYANTTGSLVTQITPYFNSRPQYQSIVSMNGPGQSHTHRVWMRDLNNDGKTDIISSELLWSATVPYQNYGMIGIFQNSTSSNTISFTDKTDQLNPDFNPISAELDKSMQMIDIDGSGIEAILHAGSLYINAQTPAIKDSIQSNWILLNDGTGRMHSYIHSGFQTIYNKLKVFMNANGITDGGQPRFISYLTPNNEINFLAEIIGSKASASGTTVLEETFVNVPIKLNPSIDFKNNISITDRNMSKKIRTWAGDDTIYDTNANQNTTIDGGLGANKCIYSGPSASYTITRNTDGSFLIFTSGGVNYPQVSDTLKNIQTIVFSDKSINL